MKRVYLVRHAIAHERSGKRWPDDSQRPLTAAGVAKFRQAARGLGTLLPKAAVILSSPYVRARESAVILARVAKRAKPIECAELAGSETPLRVFDFLQSRKDEELVLVGHEPDLSRFLAAAVAGNDRRVAVEFKKGGAACIEFPGRTQPGRGILLWMLPPRVLRTLK